MTIMIQHDDENYEALLSDYINPAEDDGFSDALITLVENRDARLARLKFGFLGAGFFIGGAIAATQFPAVVTLLASQSFSEQPIWGLTAAVIFAFVVWATLDSKKAGLF